MAENGKLPDAALSPIAKGNLRKDAAAAWNAMNVEARKRGVELYPTGSMSSYRTYAQQVYLYNEYKAGRGNLAAVPGSSNHGWGLAVDLATPAMRSMVDQIGRPFGYSKATSDAPSEWWHIKWVEGSWKGADVGPYGKGGGDVLTPDRVTDITSASNAAGVLHVFAQADDGSIWYTFQPKGGNAWKGGQAGKLIAQMVPFAPAPKP
jgi:D-alanyl-D-alanine carboxypeptidase-like protein